MNTSQSSSSKRRINVVIEGHTHEATLNPHDTTADLFAQMKAFLPPASGLNPILRYNLTRRASLERDATGAEADSFSCTRPEHTVSYQREQTFAVVVGESDDFVSTPLVIGLHTSKIDFIRGYQRARDQQRRKKGDEDEKKQTDFRIRFNKPSPVQVTSDVLSWSNCDLQVAFKRTLRVPEDGGCYSLPPDLGNLPIVAVADYKDKVPKEWAEHGGVIIPMHQSEAMWMSFSGSGKCALKCGVGKMNAITGQPWSSELSQSPQNYMARPQPWLDGVFSGPGFVKQFVAMPLGAEGKEDAGELQLQVIPAMTRRVRSYGNFRLMLQSGSEYGWDHKHSPAEMGLEMGAPVLLTAPLLVWEEENPRMDDPSVFPARSLFRWLKDGDTVEVYDKGPLTDYQIFVKTLQGRTITLNVQNRFERIGSLFEQIYYKDGSYPQRAVFGGKQLCEEQNLDDYHIQRESTVHLVLRLSAGPSDPYTFRLSESGDTKKISVVHEDCSVAECKDVIMESLVAELNPLQLRGKALHLIFDGEELENDSATLRWLGVFQGSTLDVELRDAHGLVEDGQIVQNLIQDVSHVEYDMSASSRVFVHIANSELWEQTTGTAMPPTPATAETYTQYGFPWFRFYSDETSSQKELTTDR